MNKSIIISGEASETDSEDESTHKIPTSVQGALITGEDSESENENEASICSAVSASNLAVAVQDRKVNNFDSLFSQKLKEYNVKLQTDMDSFCRSATEETAKNLNSIDQQLLRSQLTLQNAASALRSLSINSIAFKDKLQSMLSARFLPNVKVDDNK